MKFNVLSLFPQMFLPFSEQGVIGQAVSKGLIQISMVNPRDFTEDLHKTVDDRPYGGGDGMILLYEPLRKALESLGEARGQVIYLSPQGEPLVQKKVNQMAEKSGPYTLVCGRYGGIDERFISQYVDEEISVGDYVVSGGELPAMILMDAVGRQLPGVLGHEKSAAEESFFSGLLEAPLFTRPRMAEDLPVPQVLLEGDHKKIDRFRRDLGLVRTFLRRPDLWDESHEAKLADAKASLSKLTDLELRACGLSRKDLEVL